MIAGTTESREVIEQLLRKGEAVIATTATELGKEMLLQYPIEIRERRLDEQGFLQLFEEINPKEVIDASHPFAVIVTKTVQNACQKKNLPYKRVERNIESYQYDKIYTVKDTKEAIFLLNEVFGTEKILLTTGSNTLADYVTKVNNGKNRIYARVLDHEYAREICKTIPIEKGHIIYQNPPFSKEDTRSLLLKYECQVLVTKDSGKAGGVDQKIEVARQMNLPVILIERPKERQGK